VFRDALQGGVQKDDVGCRVGGGDSGIVPANEPQVGWISNDAGPGKCIESFPSIVLGSVVDDEYFRIGQIGLMQAFEAELRQVPAVPRQDDECGFPGHGLQSSTGGAVARHSSVIVLSTSPDVTAVVSRQPL